MALCRERHYPRLQKNDDRVALRPAAEPGLGPPPTTLAWAVRRQLFGIRFIRPVSGGSWSSF